MGTYQKFEAEDNPQVEEGDAKFLGVSQRLSADKLTEGLLADGTNIRLRNGEVETRRGVTKPGWINGTRSSVDAMILPVIQFYGCGSFKDPSSEEWTLEAADGGIYRCKPGNARFALTLPVAVKVLGDCSFCQAFDVVFCFRGIHLAPLIMTSVDNGFVDVEPRWSAATVYNAAILAAGQVADEVAYGPFQAVALTSVGDLVTAVTTPEHGYITGADVVVKGSTVATYNGRWNITVVDANTFTYHFTGGASPATGSPVVSNMALYWQALGSRVQLASLTRAGVTATATKTAHGFSNGQSVTILGSTVAAYNGVWVIQGVTANTFAFILPADPGADGAGVITARTSVVLAGQSPDTNPEAWQQLYNVLPNADDAVFMDGRMLVPTAYTPGANGYDSTTVYTKKDFLVAMEIGDNVHFQFTDAFRINQGDDSEIIWLVKYNQDQAVVGKGKKWGVLSGLSGADLSGVSLDMRGEQYGGCALRSGVTAGTNVLFPSTSRGLCSLAQNTLGQVRSVDIPWSNEMDKWLARINWTLAGKQRLAWWDDKLFWACAVDDGTITTPELIPSGQSYGGGMGTTYHLDALLVAGATYEYAPGIDENALVLTASSLSTAGEFVYDGLGAYLIGFALSEVTASVRLKGSLTGVNNAVLVYDFRLGATGAAWTFDYQAGQWCSLDSGSALCVKEFFKATYGGKERLFYIGEDGWANMLEEGYTGDQIAGNDAQGLGYEEIVTEAITRGYRFETDSPKRFKRLELVTEVWNAVLNIWKRTGAANSEAGVVSGQSFSRTKYLKPAGKADYVEGNGNGDYAEPGRGDYSIRLLDGVTVADGMVCEQFQEVTKRVSVRSLAGRFAQFRFRSTQGRIKVKAVAPTAEEGERRSGVLI